MKYTDENRGHIQNPKKARQLIEFTGLQYGKCTPTDIDGLIEKDNEVFIFFEIKYKDAELPNGQAIAFKHIIDNLDELGKKAVLFIGRHNVDDIDKSIVAGETEVSEVYYKKKFRSVEKKTLKEWADIFFEWAYKG